MMNDEYSSSIIIPHSTFPFGDRLAAGFLALNQATEVRTLLPELEHLSNVSIDMPMRGRLTVGRDVLDVLMLVRFQPPQLE